MFWVAFMFSSANIFNFEKANMYSSKFVRDHPKRFKLNTYVACIMYDFTIYYITTLINKMTSGNGSLSLYLTMATVKDTEKETFGKHCWKRRKCWIPAFSPFPMMLSTL